ncbi:hypothetical protein ACCO45_004045 [Purpureocillium lilacinum]|uniref:Uncharacterized protein n=1 Tax=Purpureocillium lilacinum TaxID=33203 RepID=A0ACC4E2Z5_PURLI
MRRDHGRRRTAPTWRVARRQRRVETAAIRPRRAARRRAELRSAQSTLATSTSRRRKPVRPRQGVARASGEVDDCGQPCDERRAHGAGVSAALTNRLGGKNTSSKSVVAAEASAGGGAGPSIARRKSPALMAWIPSMDPIQPTDGWTAQWRDGWMVAVGGALPRPRGVPKAPVQPSSRPYERRPARARVRARPETLEPRIVGALASVSLLVVHLKALVDGDGRWGGRSTRDQTINPLRIRPPIACGRQPASASDCIGGWPFQAANALCLFPAGIAIISHDTRSHPVVCCALCLLAAHCAHSATHSPQPHARHDDAIVNPGPSASLEQRPQDTTARMKKHSIQRRR